MADYVSNHGIIMLGLKSLIKDLQPEGLMENEVEVRENWLSPSGDPYHGVSIFDMGEQYDEGTCGTQDVGYICGVVFAKFRATDAALSDDRIIRWYEITRRRLADQRSLVSITSPSAPAEHVCIVMPGRTLTDPNKWPNYLLRQLVVVVWMRELPTN